MGTATATATATARWYAAVQAEIDAGLSPHNAKLRVEKTHPGLRNAYLAQFHEGSPAVSAYYARLAADEGYRAD